jgi:hypothetical protein
LQELPLVLPSFTARDILLDRSHPFTITASAY